MTLFTLLKLVHVGCALLSIAGFALRGYWLATDSPNLQHRVVKKLPHIVDTVLLGSALGMLLIWHASPFSMPWLTAKLIALLLYIALGMIAMRFGKTKRVRLTAWAVAMLTVFYMLSVAISKSAWGVFQLL